MNSEQLAEFARTIPGHPATELVAYVKGYMLALEDIHKQIVDMDAVDHEEEEESYRTGHDDALDNLARDLLARVLLADRRLQGLSEITSSQSRPTTAEESTTGRQD